MGSSQSFGSNACVFFREKKHVKRESMETLKSPGLKVKRLVGPTCKIPRSTQRSCSGIGRDPPIRCAMSRIFDSKGSNKNPVHPGMVKDGIQLIHPNPWRIHGTNGIFTYLHEWLIFMVNVGMDPMRKGLASWVGSILRITGPSNGFGWMNLYSRGV